MATRKKTPEIDAAKALAVPIDVTFEEDEEGNVTANFPAMNGTGPFSITLQNMHWGLIEDLERMDDEDADNRDILEFFREYVVGGPKAVPFKHTFTVFKAIRGYIDMVGEDAKNV